MVSTNLTLAEKASLTSGRDVWSTVQVEHAGIASVRTSDGPHGLRFQPGGSNSLALDSGIASTCFPPAVTLGCTWDTDLLERVAAAIAVEAASLGVDVVLGPGVNVKRSPLCGRNFEYFSEDPLLSGEFGAAMVRGLQDGGVGATLKHFAANNQETDRFRVSADIDERPLREIYLRPFERIVERARPWAVMAAYNAVNGVPATQSHRLLTEILRDEWGFDGLVMSDWGAVHDRVAALRAGLDLEMPSTEGRTDSEVEAAVTSGALPESVLDQSVERVVALSRRGGAPSDAPVPYDAHHELAREAASRGIVLLKNDDAVLPLQSGAGTVAVVGELARAPRFQGGGSSQVTPTRLDVPLAGVQAVAGADQVRFAAGYPLAADDESSASLRDEAVRVVGGADTTVLFLGLPAEQESEGIDREHLDLPAQQTALVEVLAPVTRRLVVVLVNGGVVQLTPWVDEVAAVVETWLLGQAAGTAIADVLFGAVNPSGRLTETIPLRLQDVPSYLNFPGGEGHVRYGEGVFVGYRGYDATDTPVLFPFGHGLSYTDFHYDRLVVEQTGDAVVARVTVANAGSRRGREVVQLYVAPPAHSVVPRPRRELRAFGDVTLEPGQRREVALRVPLVDLAYYSYRDDGWRVEGGDYRVEVGASSRDLRLDAVVGLVGDDRTLSRDSTLREWQDHPVGGPLVAEIFAEVRELSEEMSRLVDDPVVRRAAQELTLAAIADLLGDALPGDRIALLEARLADAEQHLG